MSRDRFDVLVRHAPAAIAVFDREMRYVVHSRRWVSDYRLGDRDLRGLRHYEVFPEIGERWKAIHRRCLEGAVERADRDRFERADGAVDWVSWSIYPWHEADDSIGGIVIFSEVVTEQVRAEQALRLSEETFRGAFDNAGIGIALVAPDGRFLRVNPALCRMVGYETAELIRLRFQDITHPDDLEPDLASMRRLLAGEVPTYTLAKRYLKPGGETVHASLNVSLVRGEDGEPRFFVSQIQDVTAQRLAEEELRHSQKFDALGRLAGGVAHDFNNLLGVIAGFTELAREEVPPDHPVRESLEQIADATGRATAITRRLLGFSRKQEMLPRPLELGAVVEEMSPLLRALVGEDIEVRLRLAPDAGRIVADPTHVQQVILNLAANAREAMPEGGRLTIEVAERRLSGEYVDDHPPTVPGRYVLLAVSDDGEGMDEETRQRCFEPFFTTRGEGRGTGLGLATCYGIVKQSGGYIWVYSELGRGTTIKVYFPRTEEAAEPVPEPVERRSVRGSETVLVVEDEESLRRFVREILERHGYRVLEAADGDAALERVREHDGPIDLLLTDVVMPRLDGPTLAARLQATRPGLPVLFMSGYTDGVLEARGGLASDLPLIEKPFTGRTLARRVREALDGTAGHDAGD